MTLDAVYVTYWSLQDPLCRSQSVPVVLALAGGGRRMGLVTFEQRRWALDARATAEQRRSLEVHGVRWSPLRYHKRPPVLSTLFDISRGIEKCLSLARGHRVRLFHGRGTVAAAVAGGASRLTGARFLDDADGPLSQEYVDAGVWRAGSLPHRMTLWAETNLLRRADAVAVLTERRRAEIRDLTRHEPVVLPCAVDLERFRPEPAARESLREELGLSGVVFVYVGKAGGWYLTGQMLEFVRVAHERLGEVSLLVLTTEAPETFARAAEGRGLHHVVRCARQEEMPRYLSAADAGLSFVLPAPSKAACSPVKNGEYLACGLPIVTTVGVGDYSDLIARRRVGVVVRDLEPRGYAKAADELRELLADASLGIRCRETARAEVGLSEVVVPRYLALYQSLLGPPDGPGA